jgi:hypothetical protein
MADGAVAAAVVSAGEVDVVADEVDCPAEPGAVDAHRAYDQSSPRRFGFVSHQILPSCVAGTLAKFRQG